MLVLLPDIVFLSFSQVFSVNNVNVVIRTRTEHLTDEEKARIKSTVFKYFSIYIVFVCFWGGVSARSLNELISDSINY